MKVYLQQMTDLQASDNSRNFSLMLSSSSKPRDCVCVYRGGRSEEVGE